MAKTMQEIISSIEPQSNIEFMTLSLEQDSVEELSADLRLAPRSVRFDRFFQKGLNQSENALALETYRRAAAIALCRKIEVAERLIQSWLSIQLR